MQEKSQLRLRVLEEGLKASSNGSSVRVPNGGEEGMRNGSNGPSRRQSIGGVEDPSRLGASAYNSKRRTATSQLRGSISSSMLVRNARSASKSFDGGRPTDMPNRNGKSSFGNGFMDHHKQSLPVSRVETQDALKENVDIKNEIVEGTSEDFVSGVLYDMLQKEVIALRKASHEKDQSLKDKDDAIEVC